MKEKSKIIMLSSLIIIVVLGLLVVRNNSQPTDTNNQLIKNDQIKPRLSAVEYTSEDVSKNKVEVRSQNYAFSIVIPDNYELSKGRGFDKKFPENESVSVGTRDQEKQSNLVYNVTIKFLNNKTITDIANTELDFFETEYSETNPLEIELKQVTINGQVGVSYQYKNAFGQDVIVYYFSKGNLYYAITASLDSGQKNFTGNQLREINEVNNSFQFI